VDGKAVFGGVLVAAAGSELHDQLSSKVQRFQLLKDKALWHPVADLCTSSLTQQSSVSESVLKLKSSALTVAPKTLASRCAIMSLRQDTKQ
jgi:hypothetical protein